MSEPAHILNRMVDLLGRSEQLYVAGRADEARESMEELRLLTENSTRIHAHVLTDLAVIAIRDGDRERAAELARQALVHLPEHVPAREVLDQCVDGAADSDHAASLSDEFQEARIDHFRRLSTCERVTGTPEAVQPILLVGDGRISFGESVQFGWRDCPGFYDRYAYVEARYPDTHIHVGSNTFFNNAVTLRAEGPGISIGADCLFGWSVQIMDSDFHDLHPRRRTDGTPATKHVRVGDNVFVGANTTIMKGVTIGDDTVIGASSVVVHSLPEGVVAAGNPATVVRALDAD